MMSERDAARMGAWSGPLFVLLVVAGFAIPGVAGLPAQNAPAPEFAAALLENRGVELGGWLLALAGVAFVCFTWSLHNALRHIEAEARGLSSLVLAAGTLYAFTWTLSGQLLADAAGMASWSEHPEGAKTAFALSSMPVDAQGPLLPALLVGATALIVRHTTSFPRWYRQASATLVFLLLIGSALSVVGLAFPLLPVSLLLFFGWILGTRVVLNRHTSVVPEEGTAAYA